MSAGSLPEEALDLCEVEPLRREEPGSARWVPDELLPSAYVRLGDLKVRTQPYSRGCEPRICVRGSRAL